MSHSIIFCGTPDFAVPALQLLLSDAAFDVSLVITQPDRPVGRKQLLTPSPVKMLAMEKGIPVFQPENINLELEEYLDAHTMSVPDYLIVVAYGKILKQPILDLPTIAPINVHGSILPRWRGASPVEHAILNGDTETGVTVQIMGTGLDEGPILSITKMPIGPTDTDTTMREKLSKAGAELLVETLKKPLKPEPQPETGITICKKLSREDAQINLSTMTAIDIDRRIRALNPWPGVVTTIEGHEMKLLEASLTETPDSIPLLCANGSTLYLTMVQEAGKKPMKAADWKRGLRNVS